MKSMKATRPQALVLSRGTMLIGLALSSWLAVFLLWTITSTVMRAILG